MLVEWEFEDSHNEKYLYQQLQASGMTFLSIGHRESLSNYHQTILDLIADRTWSLKASEPLLVLISNNLVDEGRKIETEDTAVPSPPFILSSFRPNLFLLIEMALRKSELNICLLIDLFTGDSESS